MRKDGLRCGLAARDGLVCQLDKQVLTVLHGPDITVLAGCGPQAQGVAQLVVVAPSQAADHLQDLLQRKKNYVHQRVNTSASESR